jgi:hypothetical protein
VKNEKLQRAIEARKAAFDAMDAAATAYEAAEGDDLEARKAEFEEARTAFNAAKAEVERIEEIEEARAANPGPGDPVEPEKDKRIKVTEPVTYARESLVEKRAITRVDGTGGEFVPPLWLLEEYAGLARAGRPFATRPQDPAAGRTDSINIPRITTGSLTGSRPPTTPPSPRRTWSPRRSPRRCARSPARKTRAAAARPVADRLRPDRLRDLIADYNMQLDAPDLSGSGAAGQLLGILNVAPAINAVTYTDATPTVPELWPKLADALNQASNNRKIVPTHYWMHGAAGSGQRRSSTREPAVLHPSNGPDERARRSGRLVQPGRPGHERDRRAGLPRPEHPDQPRWRHERGPRSSRRACATTSCSRATCGLRALKEILSGTLGVRFQVYAYSRSRRAGSRPRRASSAAPA